MLHFFGGLAIVAFGVVIILKREWILNNFGRLDFFEEKLSVYGGTRMAYSLIGLIAIFIGFCIAFGLMNDFLSWVLSPLLRYQQS